MDNKHLYDLTIIWLTALGVCGAFALLKTVWVRIALIALTVVVASLGSLAKVSPTNLWEASIARPGTSPNEASLAPPASTATPIAPEEVKQPQTDEHQQDHQKSLKALVTRTQIDPTRVNVVLACDTSTLSARVAAEAQSKLAKSLKKLSDRAAVHVSMLRPEFKKDGYFDRAFNGDFAFLADTGLFDSAQVLVLCRVKADVSTNSGFDGLFSSSTEIKYRVISRKVEQVDSGSVHVVGPGTSADAAIIRGIELAVERNQSTFRRFLDPPDVLPRN